MAKKMVDERAGMWSVKIPTWGKTAEKTEAETPEEAVSNIVGMIAKRIGEPPHIMAIRLDRYAEVTSPEKRSFLIDIREACPPPEPGISEDVADEMRGLIAGEENDETETPGL